MSDVIAQISQLIAEAQSANSANQESLEVAMVIWEALRHRFPTHPAGYQQAIGTLKQHGRLVEAAALSAEAISRFPEEVWPLADAGWLAVLANDYPAAIAYGAQARAQFPTHQTGYSSESFGLRKTQRYDEAEQVLTEAAMRFPDEVWVGESMAWLSSEQGNWAQTLTRADALRLAYPSRQTGYMLGWRARANLERMDEAAELLTEAQRRFPKEVWPWIDAAWMANKVHDIPKSLELWGEVRRRCPENVDSYINAGWTHLSLGQLDEAEFLFKVATQLFPNDRRLALEYAKVAEQKGDWEVADQRWASARQRLPRDAEIATHFAICPALARRAESKKNWDVALARLSELNEEFPSYPGGFAAHLDVLRRRGMLTEAAALAQTACETFPADADLCLEAAKIFKSQERPDLAAARLTAFNTAFEGDKRVALMLVVSLTNTGQYDEADNVCRAAMARFPISDMYRQYARVATRRGDANAATERWHEAERRFPEDMDLRSEASAARFAVSEPDSAPAEQAPPHVHVEAGRSLAEVMMTFESLGGTAQGCEFGIVQRQLGAEPIGLLRWSSMTLEPLIAALESSFEGVGTAEQTRLDFYTHDNGELEYRTSDTRFMMQMHTFIRKDMMPFDKMFLQSCRRLRFLKSRLLEDLAAGEKIFVFKTGHRRHSDAEIAPLFTALRRHGNAALLYVREQDDTHGSGSVECLEDGLMIGYLDHFSQTAAGSARPPNFTDWTRICTEAYAILTRMRSRLPASLVAT